ncbi:MAG: DUF58 domain-containing protein [Candidatus Hydrogenedentes bacterium]|nr:DUF58 domain-containing protein [Candidatus Hydrogenedentota bacterium]
MIVPRSRLLFWVGMVGAPFAALAATVPSAAPLSLSFIGGLVVIALLDAALAYGRLDGIDAALPEVVRLSKGREGAIDVRVSGGGKPCRLRIGLAFPQEFASPQDDVTAVLEGGHEWFRIPWPCTPARRGVFALDAVYVEGASPIGFWAVRRAVPARCELRVYPDLAGERRTVAALFLNRGGLGIHAQRQVGKGREFEKLREYLPGDNYDEIHWKATAKRGRPVTKVYQLERTQEVYVAIDMSRLSARTVAVPRGAAANGTGQAETTTQLERFITASLVLGLAAERQGDLFGLISFSDSVDRFVRARKGKSHYSTCRDAIFGLQPRIVNPDFDELCAFIRLRLRRRALVVVLTNLDDPVLAEAFTRNIELIRRQHLVLVNMLAPHGVQPLFSDARAASMDDVYGQLCGHLQWHDLRELERVLHHLGVTFSLLRNESLAAQLVTQYVNVKQRQLL